MVTKNTKKKFRKWNWKNTKISCRKWKKSTKNSFLQRFKIKSVETWKIGAMGTWKNLWQNRVFKRWKREVKTTKKSSWRRTARTKNYFKDLQKVIFLQKFNC